MILNVIIHNSLLGLYITATLTIIIIYIYAAFRWYYIYMIKKDKPAYKKTLIEYILKEDGFLIAIHYMFILIHFIALFIWGFTLITDWLDKVNPQVF